MTQLIYLLIYFSLSQLQPTSVEGLWITQDDESGKQKSEVLIYKDNGKLYGKIVRLLLPEDQGKICVNCKGKDKGKLIAGLVIVNNLIWDGESWEDGTILDPKSGKLYDCYITLEGNNNLKVRGFLGFSILGRTQNWIRKK
jgi:uncharacterized protein (DUF2147 family)